MKAIAVAWFAQGRTSRGSPWWARSHYTVMSPGDFVEALEELLRQDDPFAAYPAVHYETQSDHAAVAEDEAAFDGSDQAAMEVPRELVPAVRELIAKNRR